MLDTMGKSTTQASNALKSNNELLDANSKYMDTVSAKLKTLGTEFSIMFQNGIDSSSMKGLLDTVISLTSNFGNLHTVVSLVGLGIMAFKGADILTFFTRLPAKIIGSITSLQLFKDVSLVMQLQEAGLITSNNAVALSFQMIGTSIKEVFLSNPLGWIALGITAVVMAVDAWNNASQAQIDNLSKVSDQIKNEQSDIDGLQGKLKTLDELHSKTTLTNDDKNQLKTVNNDLANQYPELISYYDKESKSFVVSTSALKDLIAQKEKVNMQDNANNLQQAKDAAAASKKREDEAKAQLNSGVQNNGNSSINKNSKGYVSNDVLNTTQKQKLLDTIAKEDKAQGTLNQTVNQGTQMINDYTTSQQKNGTSQANINKGLLGLGYSQNEINDAIKMGITDTNANTDATNKGTNAVNSYNKALLASTNGIDTSKAKANDLASAMDNVNTQMQKSKTIISSANTILDQHTKSSEWDMDAILKLSASYPQLLTCIGNDSKMTQELTKIKTDESDKVVKELQVQIDANIDCINILGSAYEKDAFNKNASEEAKNKSVKDAITKRIAMYQDELQAMNEVSASPTIDVDPKTGKLTVGKAEGLTDKEKSGQANATAGLAQAQADLAKLTTSDSAYKSVTAVKENLGKYLTTAGDSTDNGITGTATSAADKKAQAAETAKEKKATEAQAKLDKAKAEAEKKQAAATQKQADDDAKAQEKVAKDQLNVANATTDASRKKAQQNLAIDIAAEAAIKKKGETAAEIEQAKIDAINAQTATATGLAEQNATKLLNTELASSNALIASYQKQIDLINQKADTEDKATQQLKYQNDILKEQTALKNAQQDLTVRAWQDGQWKWTADQSAIATAQTTLTDTQTEFAKWTRDNANQVKIDNLNTLIKVQQDKQATLNSSKTTGYAEGTDYVPKTNVYTVGEKGEEQVILPQGAQVIPNNKLNGTQATSTTQSPTTSSNSTTNDAINKIIANADTSLKKFITSTPQYSQQIDDKLGKSLKQNDTLLKTPLATLLSDVDTSIDTFVSASPSYSKSLEDNMGKSVKTNDLLLKTPIDTLISDISKDIQKFVDASPIYGKNTDKNIGDAITANDVMVTVPMSAVISKVKTALDTFVTSMTPEGAGIVTNLGTGITSKNKDIVDIVTKLTKQIIDLFNTGFGIQSPSKVMYKIGDYLMQGLINGMSSADIEGFITNKISGMTGSAGGVLGANLVTEAEKYLGTPYVWGGTNANGFDCSGLVQYVYSQLGVSIGRTTTQQSKEGTAVAKKDLQPGDIVFFGDPSNPDHEGMYIGNGKIIQSPHTGDVVKETNLSDMSNYAGARRIITDSSSATGSSTDIIKQALALTGTSASWLTAMQQLLKDENDNGSQTTVSKTKNGDLGYATGLFQMMVSTFNSNASSGHTNILNGVDNAMSAIEYIKKTYGNPANIKYLYDKPNYKGYDIGTDNATAGYHSVAETAPELVIGNQVRKFEGGETVFDGKKTMNLMEWSKLTPDGLLKSIIPNINISTIPEIKVDLSSLKSSGNTTFNIDHVELPEVKDSSNFMSELINYSKTH